MLLARSILKNSISLVSGIKERHAHIASITSDLAYLHTSKALERHCQVLLSHQAKADSILECAKSTAHLLEKILEFRNDETIKHNSVALREIASETRVENEIMTSLTKQSTQDSKLLKALTALATMYLPATLFATVFSSNLVELRAAEGGSGRARLNVSQDFWIYIVLTLSVTVFTSVLLLWLNKRWTQPNIGAVCAQPACRSASSRATAP